jgi:hypothetical protein
MKMITNQFQATHYYEINGQQFRPFLLNIEAFSRIADNPHGFNGETFYQIGLKGILVRMRLFMQFNR